jgi:hypothetical protein
MRLGMSHVSFGFVDTSFPFWLFLFLEDKYNIGKEFGLQANVFGGSIDKKGNVAGLSVSMRRACPQEAGGGAVRARAGDCGRRVRQVQ